MFWFVLIVAVVNTANLVRVLAGWWLDRPRRLPYPGARLQLPHEPNPGQWRTDDREG